MTNSSKLNKEDIKVIAQYENILEMAHNGYIRGIYKKDVELLKPIYEKIGGKISCTSCGSSILGMFQDFYTYVWKQKKSKKSKEDNNERSDKQS